MSPIRSKCTGRVLVLFVAVAIAIARGGTGLAGGLKYPIVLVAGTFGSWSSDRFAEMQARADESALAPFLPSVAMALGWRRVRSDSDRSRDERRYIIDYAGTGVVHQGPSTWYLDPITGAYTAFLDYLCLSPPMGKGLRQWQDVFVFCWDGVFESVEGNARSLQQFVSSVLALTGAEGVQLVAHSQGGIIARDYVERRGGDRQVQNLVLVGAPLGGAYAVDAIVETGAYPVTLPPRPTLWEWVQGVFEAALMNSGLWCVSDGGPQGRLKALGDASRAFSAEGETSPLMAMTAGYGATKAEWEPATMRAIPRLSTVLSLQRQTPQADEGIEGMGYRVVREGDGTVTELDARVPAPLAEQTAHILIGSESIPHRSYFQTRAFLETWVADAVEFTPSSPAR